MWKVYEDANGRWYVAWEDAGFHAAPSTWSRSPYATRKEAECAIEEMDEDDEYPPASRRR